MTQAARTEPQADVGLIQKMTFEEFLAWADEDTHAEWVDGEILYISPSENVHVFLLKWLIKALDEYILARDLGTLFFTPYLMRLASRPSGREPDALFLAKENLARDKKTYLDGPADLVIEIVSPESDHRDRVEKLQEYEQGGVREYWVLDPKLKEALFYQLDANHRYQAASLDAEGLYHSAVLTGLWLQVDWLWQEPLPKLLDVLKAWNLL